MMPVPGCNSGTSTSRTYAAKASPFFASLITQRGINWSVVRRALKVWVPHALKVAFISRRDPRRLRPHCRVRLRLDNKDQSVSLSLHCRYSVFDPIQPKTLYTGAEAPSRNQRLFLYVCPSLLRNRQIEAECAITPMAVSSTPANFGEVMSPSCATSSSRSS
jgi:hypothetical protein